MIVSEAPHRQSAITMQTRTSFGSNGSWDMRNRGDSY
jgi:hypothetical protein